MCFADFKNSVVVRALSVQVHYDHCFRIRVFFECFFQRLRIHIPGLIFAVNKDRRRFEIKNRIRARRESQARTENKIALFDAKCFKSEMDRRRTGDECGRVGRVEVRCNVFFEPVNVGAQRGDPVGIESLLNKFKLFPAHMRGR